MVVGVKDIGLVGLASGSLHSSGVDSITHLTIVLRDPFRWIR